MRNHFLVAGAVVAAVCCVPAICHAQSVPFTHEGFYLQMTLGGGYLRSSASFPLSGSNEDVSYYGGAVNGSLWIGGSLVPGFVLGGGTLGAIAISPSAKVTYQGQSETGTSNSSTSLQLNMIGLISDYYPNPSKGLHFQALLGYAVMSLNDHNSSNYSASGLGVMGGVGYEFWVSEEWSIGVLGRFAYAATKYQDTSWPTIAPALLASFTYN